MKQGLDGPDPASCPYHATDAQLKLLSTVFGKRVFEEQFPFVPDASGDPASKQRMVQTTCKIAKLTGREVYDENGRLIFTGHWPRIAGSREMALGEVDPSRTKTTEAHT